jgi:hypothetical protein
MKKLFLSMYDTYVIYHGYEFKYSESTGSHPAISYRKVHHTYHEKMNRLLPLKKQHPIDLFNSFVARLPPANAHWFDERSSERIMINFMYATNIILKIQTLYICYS